VCGCYNDNGGGGGDDDDDDDDDHDNVVVDDDDYSFTLLNMQCTRHGKDRQMVHTQPSWYVNLMM